MREIRRRGSWLQVIGWQRVWLYFVALAKGGSTVFETAAFDHSATSPF
jgi:hypothetical protein